MIRVWVAVAWLAIGSFAFSSSAEAEYLEDRNVGAWHLTASASDSDERAVCFLLGPSDGSTLLGIMAERLTHSWYLSLIDKNWHMQKGDRQPITYTIDENAPVAVDGEVGEPTILVFPLGKSFSVMEPLRSGHRIVLRDEVGTALSFSLDGSSRALDALADCANRQLGFEVARKPAEQNGLAATNPFSAPGKESPAAAAEGGDATLDSTSEAILQTLKTTKSPAVEALLMGQVFLDEAHLTGYSEMLDSNSADWIDGYDALWKLPKARVGFDVLDDITATFADEFFSGVSASVQTACRSPARVERISELAPGIIGRLHVYCEGASSSMLILFHRPRGGSYLMTVMGDLGPGGTVAAEKYDDQIARVLIDRAASQ
jgi:hypothetical protein